MGNIKRLTALTPALAGAVFLGEPGLRDGTHEHSTISSWLYLLETREASQPAFPRWERGPQVGGGRGCTAVFRVSGPVSNLSLSCIRVCRRRLGSCTTIQCEGPALSCVVIVMKNMNSQGRGRSRRDGPPEASPVCAYRAAGRGRRRGGGGAP